MKLYSFKILSVALLFYPLCFTGVLTSHSCRFCSSFGESRVGIAVWRTLSGYFSSRFLGQKMEPCGIKYFETHCLQSALIFVQSCGSEKVVSTPSSVGNISGVWPEAWTHFLQHWKIETSRRSQMLLSDKWSIFFAAEIGIKRILNERFFLPGIFSRPSLLAFVLCSSSFWLFSPPFLRGKADSKVWTHILALIEFLRSGQLIIQVTSPAHWFKKPTNLGKWAPITKVSKNYS